MIHWDRSVIPERMPQIAYAIWMPPMLPRCGMGCGETMSHIQMGTDAPAVGWYIGLALHTALTADARWIWRAD